MAPPAAANVLQRPLHESRRYAPTRTRVVTGLGSLAALPTELGALAVRRVLLVCDRGLLEAEGAEPVLTSLPDRVATLLHPADPDPSPEAVEEATAAAAEAGCDAVVAIGGGSGLGLGKAVALRLANDRDIRALAGVDRAPRAPVPCLAIPTTAGSGSEVSNVLVLHDKREPLVTVVRGTGYEPAVAILDGRLLRTLPDGAMLDAGLDAFSHAIEALWARGGLSFTDALAAHAARVIAAQLPRALESRADDVLQILLEASAIANQACGASGLTLPHAIASATGLGVSHGRQTGVLLPHAAAFNAPELGTLAREAAATIEPLYRELDFTPTFRPGELDAVQAARMLAAGLASPLAGNNPRSVDGTAVRAILAAAGAPHPTASPSEGDHVAS
jgi:alcohol dehydrogenase class IV